MHETWDAARVMAVLATLKDNGVSVREMTRLSGANRSTIYRWMSAGDGQPDYAIVNRLARAVWRQHPDLARELVEASGYAWAEPTGEPEPVDVLAEVWGQDVAGMVRAEVRKRVPQQAEAILRAIEDDLSQHSAEDASASGRAAGLYPPGRAQARL